MKEFKVGDEVKCVEEIIYMNEGIEVGKVYEIDKIGSFGYLGFKNMPKHYIHEPDHFEFVEELTEESALEWSIKKWEYIVENESQRGLFLKYPNLKNYDGDGCALCEYYKMGCSNCPLRDVESVCCKEFTRWNRYHEIEDAKDLLDRLYQIRDSKYPKYKLGDKFICIKDFYTHAKKDDIITVNETWGDAIWFEGRDGKSVKYLSGLNEYFKPFEYKIGDKFIVLKNYFQLKEGEIVEIDRKYGKGFWFKEKSSGREAWDDPDLDGFNEEFKPLDKETEAILGSIKKWEDIRDIKGIDEGNTNCPLCQLYYKNVCGGCPVNEGGNHLGCYDTPYRRWNNHHLINHKAQTTIKCRCLKCVVIAQEEVDFLKSLLHKDKKESVAIAFGIPNTTKILTLYDGWKDIVDSAVSNMHFTIGYAKESEIVKPIEPKLTLKEAIDLSIKKWEWIVKHGGIDNQERMFKDIPELKSRDSVLRDLGICYYYKKNVDCYKCPIKTPSYNCNHIYHDWLMSYFPMKHAVKLLNIVYQIKEDYEEGKLNEN